VRETTIDLNRVEGNLELRLDVEDEIVRDSRCGGTMYRRYEQIPVGRAEDVEIRNRVSAVCFLPSVSFESASRFAPVSITKIRLHPLPSAR
jgi:Ni,Fe-hydrogenase I large subunit